MGKISKNVVEEDAIKQINNLIDTNFCQSFIKHASTESSYDGYVNLFANRNKSEKDGMIIIHVQSKGSTSKYTGNKFSVKMDDFRNYSSQGVCYFVTLLTYNEEKNVIDSKIFGRAITAIEADRMVKKYEGLQLSFTLKFSYIKNKDDMLKLFRAYETKARVTNLGNEITSEENLIGKQLTLIDDSNNIGCYPEIGKEYFGIIEGGGKKSFINSITFSEEITLLNGPVRTQERIFFNNVQKRENIKNSIYLDLNHALSLELKGENRLAINLNYDAYSIDVELAVSFLVSAFTYHKMYIGTYEIPIMNDDVDSQRMIKEYQGIFLLAKSVNYFFKAIGYNKPFSLKELSNDNVNDIAIMLYGSVKNETDYFFIKTKFVCKKIVRVYKDDTRLFFSIFDEKLYSLVKFPNSENKKILTTPFIYMSVNEWLDIDLEPLINFSSVIMKNVTNCDLNINDYRRVAEKIYEAYLQTKKQLLYEYASFLNNYFKLNLIIEM